MIDIAGSTHRAYLFPSARPAAYEFYSDFGRVVSHLALISLQQPYGQDRYRLLYHSIELGVYRVRILCDVHVRLDRAAWTLRVEPWVAPVPVVPEAGMALTQGQGLFASESIFHDEGDHTRVEYRLSLGARLPVPIGLRLVPHALLDGIAHSITTRRMQDITDRFIARSISAFEKGRRPRPRGMI